MPVARDLRPPALLVPELPRGRADAPESGRGGEGREHGRESQRQEEEPATSAYLGVFSSVSGVFTRFY